MGGGGPKGRLDIDPETVGRWQTSAELARRMGVYRSSPCDAYRDGRELRGFSIDRREATQEDRDRGAPPQARYMYRATLIETDGPVHVLCDVVCGRLIPEYSGTRAECKAYANRRIYAQGPPTKIIEMDEPPELGVWLRGVTV